MMLTLSVLTYRNQPTQQATAGRFSDAGGALGRGPDNLLVLDDPGKYISRTHARVSCRGGTYFLEDVGSNPSVVNDRPLGKGREIMLADGDRIVIGDYQLEARVVAEAPAAPWLPPAPLNDPALPLFEPPPVAAPVPLPPLESPSVVAAVPAYQGAPFDALAGARILDVAHTDGVALALDDPLGLNLFAAPSPAPVMPGDFGRNLAPQYHAAESDHVSPELVPFRMPVAKTQKPAAGGFAIPHDYDPLADFLPPVLAPASTPQQPAAAPPSPASEPVAARAEPVQTVAAPPPAAAVPPSTMPASVPAASDGEILQALLRGLGLPDLQLNRSGVQVAETVGAMLREATTGTMDVLMARALTKKESRIDMTMISVSANNPLKFFPNPDSALTQMLTNTMAGYMPPVQAIRGAYDDLKAHELAVIAGMRAALAAVLQRFDPARIESRLAVPSVMDKMMVSHRKAKLWDRLVLLYGEIAREADDDLQRLYGEKFSEAYEEQVARLRQARK